MALTLSRCVPRLMARTSLRPHRAMPVMAFKDSHQAREKTDLAKPQKEKDKAVAKAPTERGLSAHPIRRLSDAMELMNREMHDMMNAFGMGGFMEPLALRPFSMMDRLADLERPLMELNTGRLVPVEVQEDDTGYTFFAEVPGFKKDEIKVTFDPEAHMLTMTGEQREEEKVEGKDEKEPKSFVRRSSSFTRAFRLPQDAETNNTAWKACTKDGVLQLRVPKAVVPKKPQVEIPLE